MSVVPSSGTNRRDDTFGPSLIRIAGIPSLGMDDVFHQLGAPRREIFSSTLSWRTNSGIDASRKERDMMVTRTQAKWMKWQGVLLYVGVFSGNLVN